MKQQCNFGIPIHACIVIVKNTISVALWLEKSLEQLSLGYLMHPNCDRKYYKQNAIHGAYSLKFYESYILSLSTTKKLTKFSMDWQPLCV